MKSFVIACNFFLISLLIIHTTAVQFRTVCYVAGWAHYRPGPVSFDPEDIDTSLCTHLIFAFALLDQTGVNIVAEDLPADIERYQRLTSLKREKPDLKVLLSIGGWVLGTEGFSALVTNASSMAIFASNTVSFLHKYNFDGVDIDWEFPGDRGSPATDKHGFTLLLQALHQSFQADHQTTGKPQLLLSAAISPTPFRVKMSYEIENIAKYTDFLNVMTYDMHGSWETTLGHHSSLFSSTEDYTDSIDYVVNLLANSSVPRNSMNLGLPFYGRTVNLLDPQNFKIGAPITGAGAAGSITKEEGTLSYIEICQILTSNSSGIVNGRLPGLNSPFVVDGSRYTSYDDINSIKEKVDYVVKNDLGGVAIWSIDMDDFHGLCGQGHSPLLKTVRDEFNNVIVG